MKSIRKILESLFPFGQIQEYSKDDSRFQRAVSVVRYFYALNVFWFIYIFIFTDQIRFDVIRNAIVWPLFWSFTFTTEQIALAVFSLFFLSIIIGTFFPERRWGRLLVFIVILEYVAMEYSFRERGTTAEWWYPWLYTSFLFIFLPDFYSTKKYSLEIRSKFLLILWGTQALFLLVYTMVGLHKFIYLANLVALKEINIFSPEVFSGTSAYFITKYDKPINPIFSFMMQWPVIIWVSQLGIMFVQLLAFIAALRPSLQKLWAFLLISFHIATGIAFNIVFLHMVLLLIVLFYDSPFLSQKPLKTFT